MLEKNDEIKIQKIVEKTTVKVVVEALEKIILPKFDAIDEKFDDIDKRFDDVDQKFNDIDKRFDGVDERLNNIEERLETIEDTTTRTELKLNAVVKRQDDQGDQIIKINKTLKLRPNE